jgi:hypothetical protein
VARGLQSHLTGLAPTRPQILVLLPISDVPGILLPCSWPSSEVISARATLDGAACPWENQQGDCLGVRSQPAHGEELPVPNLPEVASFAACPTHLTLHQGPQEICFESSAPHSPVLRRIAEPSGKGRSSRAEDPPENQSDVGRSLAPRQADEARAWVPRSNATEEIRNASRIDPLGPLGLVRRQRLHVLNGVLKRAVGLHKVLIAGVPDALTVCSGLRPLNQTL